MGSLLQFREQKAPWYDRTTICILTCLIMAWLFWFGWVGIQLALEKGHASYLFTPVLIALGTFYIFVKTIFRLRKRWRTYQKFKSM